MSIIAAFFPIVLVLIVIGLLSVLVGKITTTRKRYLYGKGIIWVFGGYIVILLFSVGLFFLIPEKNANSGEDISIKTVNKESRQLYEAAIDGRMDAIDGAYIKEQWTFDYTENQLVLETPGNDVNGPSIFIERKKESDDTVDAIYYQIPSSIEGRKIAKPLTPTVDLTKSALTIEKPEPVELEFTIFKEEFPITQFTEAEGMFDSSIGLGMTLLYIRIPKDLDLKTDSYAVEYVDE